jgi:hypothetical protein
MWTPLLHHQGWLAGRDCLCQPPQGLHGNGRYTWQSVTPRPTPGQELRWFRSHQVGLLFRPAGFLTFPFSGAAKRQSRNRFSGRGPVFCTPWTTAPSQSPQQRNSHRQRSPPQRLDL